MADGMEGGKRALEDQRHNHNKRPRGDGNGVTFRLMIRSTSAGGVIGKGGENIKRLRSDYEAKVSIPDCNGPERIIKIVTKTLDSALDCIQDIIPCISDHKKQAQDQDKAHVRIMVHQSHAGAIIGRAGFKIKELREKTGAHFKVYTETCPKSTDRVVQLTGSPEVIAKAAREVYTICSETPVKGPVQDYDPFCHDLQFYDRYGGYLYDSGEEGGERGGYGGGRGGGGGGWNRGGHHMGPSPGRGNYDHGMSGGSDNFGYGRSPFGGGGGGGHMQGGIGMRGGRGGRGRGGMGNRGGSGGFGGQQFSDQGMDYGGDRGSGGYGGGGGGGGGFGSGGGGGSGESVQTQQVTIPNDLAGSIIGKGGERIRNIRARSGAQIKIDDPIKGSKDRIITISGTDHAIAHAKFLLQSSVREYQGRGGGQ